MSMRDQLCTKNSNCSRLKYADILFKYSYFPMNITKIIRILDIG